MCDCYSHGCEICKKPLPVHIGDFIVDREDIKVYCGGHIPKNFKGAIWEFTESTLDFEDSKEYPAGTKIGIELIATDKIKKMRGYYIEGYDRWLHPNWCSSKIIKTQKVLK